MSRDSQAEAIGLSGQPRDWQQPVTQLKWQAERWTATGGSDRWMEKNGSYRLVSGWMCQVLFSSFCVSFSLNFIATVDNTYTHLRGRCHFIPFVWFPSPPEEGSTLLPNVFVTSAIASILTLQSLLCNLLRRSMQTEVIILTIAAHPLHASHPCNLIFTLSTKKNFRLKHSLSHTLWFMKDEQYNLQQTSITSSCIASPLLSQLALLFWFPPTPPFASLLLLHPIITPVHGSHLEWYI